MARINLDKIENAYRRGMEILNDDDPLNDVEVIPLQLLINNEINMLYQSGQISHMKKSMLKRKFTIIKK